MPAKFFIPKYVCNEHIQYRNFKESFVQPNKAEVTTIELVIMYVHIQKQYKSLVGKEVFKLLPEFKANIRNSTWYNNSVISAHTYMYIVWQLKL